MIRYTEARDMNKARSKERARCPVCGDSFIKRRKWQIYDEDACRMRAWIDRLVQARAEELIKKRDL